MSEVGQRPQDAVVVALLDVGSFRAQRVAGHALKAGYVRAAWGALGSLEDVAVTGKPCLHLYPHDEPEAYAAGVSYFPDGMRPAVYYEPTDRGLEARIKERFMRLRARDREERGS